MKREGRFEIRRGDCGSSFIARSLTAKYPSSIQFSYFDQNGDTTTNCAAVRTIRIKLTLTSGGRDYIFQTAVSPLGLQ
ncbi:MAG: hypothetical protein V1674_01205 [Candidatus Omnitrophota bacterium]